MGDSAEVIVVGGGVVGVSTAYFMARAGAEVRVEQVRHEFWFGAALANHVFGGRMNPEDAAQYKKVFLENFNVSLAQKIYPASDISEQISMAGKEASGTGNMKFALNGALTVGTLDGANIEIRERVGEENFFLFGLTADEVFALKEKGYNPRDYYNGNNELKAVIDSIADGQFSNGDTELFKPILDSLLIWDEYLVLVDYVSYIEIQERAEKVYQDKDQWTRRSILNMAHCGFFSSDRSMRQYCEEIWKVKPVEVK